MQEYKIDVNANLQLNKAPSGDMKKYYAVGCNNGNDWKCIHELLTNDNTSENNIPCHSIECTDLKEHSDTRAVYLLTDEEAEIIRNHPKVLYVHYDMNTYPDEFIPVHSCKNIRYSTKARQYRNFTNSGNTLFPLNQSPSANNINQSGYQILRLTQKEDPFFNQNLNGTFFKNENIEYYGDGSDVDVVVADEGCWIGHPEFNYSENSPKNYVPGNVLRSGFSSSSTTGTCGVLDLVLDAPYYIDPEWFEENPDTRLTSRWDGTKVPEEFASKEWWSNSNRRSSQFQNIGTISINNNYTRSYNNGTNINHPFFPTIHGTQCTSLCFGKTHGWAFNANKWIVKVYSDVVLNIQTHITQEQYYDILKIFHKHKPNNKKYGTKDPTISSNSFGSSILYDPDTIQGDDPVYYYYRGASGVEFDKSSVPGFMQHRLYDQTNGNTFGGTFEYKNNSFTVAGREMIDSGAIFCCSVGNSSQKLVTPNHPDYNNYWGRENSGITSEYSIVDSTDKVYLPTNRLGYPSNISKYSENGSDVYRSINIGALDDGYYSEKEARVSYSNCGNAVDCYLPGDGVMCAVSWIKKPDGYKTASPGDIDSSNLVCFSKSDSYIGLGTTACDSNFGGTSASCPIAVGLIATKLQYNRDWTWKDVKNWIFGINQPVGITTVGIQSSSTFYYGIESDEANDASWSDKNSLQGGNPIVLWDAPTGKEPNSVTLTLSS